MMRTGALAWLLVAGLAAATLAGAGRDHARAEGAIAVGTTGNVERDGIAFGMEVNVSKDQAGETAVKRCRTFEARAAAGQCKVVATFSRECFAIAYDPKPGTPGAGWGVGPDQLAANQKAVAMCEQAAGPARKGYCQVERFGCDTTGPKASDAKPVPDTDSKAAPDTDSKPGPDTKQPKEAEEAAKATEEAKDTTKGLKPAEEAKPVKEVQDPKAAKEDTKPGQAHTVSVAPPPSTVAPSAPKPRTVAEPARSRTRSPAAPLLPVLALAGVGLAYAVGQHLRGRLKDGVAEWHIITGGALAVAAAIAVKLVDMAGASMTMAAALAGLIALGAALLA